MFKTLIHALAHHAELDPHLLFARFLERGEVADSLTYRQAWELAARWGTLLADRGVQRGQSVALALPNSIDFVGAYFGALLIGATPAPLAPPRHLQPGDPYLQILAQRLRFIQAGALVVSAAHARAGEASPLSDIPDLRVLTRRDLPPTPRRLAPGENADDLALLQYTSGTSGSAKAVELTHAALLAQIRGLSEALQLVDRTQDWAVSWLPFHHDMGLIGFLLTACYHGGHVTFMPTEDFILRPGLWIKALSDFRASITGGPPSAYALCARRLKPSEAAGFDLSRVRIALVGAEMISPETLQLAAEAFRPAGFRASSLLPSYGLAESSLAVTISPLESGPEFERLDLAALQNEGVALPTAGETRSPTRAVVSLGRPLPQVEVAIVGEAGRRLDERRIGEVIVRSPSLMRGYHRQPEASRAALRDGWLWTGDVGYLAGGKLYLTGRKKDVLIVGGRNYYPDDLEQVVARTPGVRLGRSVAISYDDPERATEAVVVLVETALAGRAEREALRQRVRQALIRADYPISRVILLRPKTIQTTPNGKLMRAEMKARYLTGEFAEA